MARIARTLTDVVLGEAVSGTPQERYQDMLGIASVISNRSTLTGRSKQSVISAKRNGYKQFDAYGKALPKGTEALRSLAEQAIAEVEKNGPVHDATYYATEKAYGRLPAGLQQVTKTKGHIYARDPQNRPIVTADGVVSVARDKLADLADAVTGGVRDVAEGVGDALGGIATGARNAIGIGPGQKGGPSKGRYTGQLDQSPMSNIGFQMGPNRPEAPSTKITDTIREAVHAALGPGYTVSIGSGTEGESRAQYGSRRHKTTFAADFSIQDPTGRTLNAVDDREDMVSVAEEAATRGVKGIGIGTNYMGGTSMHMDMVTADPALGEDNQWGNIGNAEAQRLEEARAGLPQNIRTMPSMMTRPGQPAAPVAPTTEMAMAVPTSEVASPVQTVESITAREVGAPALDMALASPERTLTAPERALMDRVGRPPAPPEAPAPPRAVYSDPKTTEKVARERVAERQAVYDKRVQDKLDSAIKSRIDAAVAAPAATTKAQDISARIDAAVNAPTAAPAKKDVNERISEAFTAATQQDKQARVGTTQKTPNQRIAEAFDAANKQIERTKAVPVKTTETAAVDAKSLGSLLGASVGGAVKPVKTTEVAPVVSPNETLKAVPATETVVGTTPATIAKPAEVPALDTPVTIDDAPKVAAVPDEATVAPITTPEEAVARPQPVQAAQPAAPAKPSVPSLSVNDVLGGAVGQATATDGNIVSRDDMGNTAVTNKYGVTTVTNAQGRQMASGAKGPLGKSSLAKGTGGIFGKIGDKIGDKMKSVSPGGILGSIIGGMLGGAPGAAVGGLLGSKIGNPNADMSNAFPDKPAQRPGEIAGSNRSRADMASISPGAAAAIDKGQGGLY
jgi:hypothetical protein